MTSRSRQANVKGGHRMNATQILSFQSNLYSQTDMQLKTSSRTRSNGNRSRIIDEKGEYFKGHVAQDDNRPNDSKPAPFKKAGDQKKKRTQEFNQEGAESRRECKSSDVHSTKRELNWQQATLLKSKCTNRDTTLPAWAKTSNASKQDAAAPTRTRGRGVKDVHIKSQLPPLRFTSGQGRSAWKFVLLTPKQGRPNDLPKWYDSDEDDLIVTLGYRRHSTDSSNLTPPSSPSLSKQGEQSDSDSSLSIDDPSSTDAHSEQQSGCTSSSDLVNSMIKSFTIYAGPSFSAAAPLACHLPAPTFLTRA